MTPDSPHEDPPVTLAQRLEKLNDNLQALGQRLQDAIASAVGTAVADAVRDGVQRLLARVTRISAADIDDGLDNDPHRPFAPHPDEGSYDEEGEPFDGRSHGQPGCAPWREEYRPRRSTSTQPPEPARRSGRWLQALGTAFQAGCWWLRRQNSRRPLLTTAAVAVVAGVAAFFVGPAAGAALGVLTSAAGLILTSESAGSAAGTLAAAAG